MKIKDCYSVVSRLGGYTSSLSLLFARFAIAYGFYTTGMMKTNDIDGIATWFASMNIPFPVLNAYMATGTELVGALLLVLGLLTRVISIPLIVVMIVAIVTVHWGHGFAAGDNGFEIPLYYILFLFIFFAHGAGKFSLDYWLFREKA